MSDIRRTILWVIFVFASILLWDKWQIHNGNQPLFFPSLSHPATTAPASSTQAAQTTNSATSAAGQAAATPTSAGAAAATEQLYAIETDVYKLKFSSLGGRLVYAELLKYLDNNHSGKNIVLLDARSNYHYLVQSGFIAQDRSLPNHQTPMRMVSTQTQLADGEKTLTVQLQSEPVGGVVYTSMWTFTRGSYVVQVTHGLKNVAANPVQAELYLQLLRDDQKPEGESSLYFTFTGPVWYSKEKGFHKLSFEDIAENKVKPLDPASDGFVGMVQHYFATSWILPQGVARSFYTRHETGTNWYNVGMRYALGELAPQAEKQVQSTLFLGPQLEKVMAETSPGLELVKDYGWTAIISKPLYWLLFELHRLLQNWGWSIVALVVLLKAALYWFNAKAYASMAKMKAVSPRITELRERLKDDPGKMQKEMMRIYREEKVNPMGGCLPMLIQIPIFFALYWVLLSSVEMRGAPWIGWIHDLAQPDPWFILPVIMLATTLLQTWLNPQPADPMQARLMWIMPLMFSVMFFFFPAGLVLYWVTNNILTIAQQWIINRRLGVN